MQRADLPMVKQQPFSQRVVATEPIRTIRTMNRPDRLEELPFRFGKGQKPDIFKSTIGFHVLLSDIGQGTRQAN
ncbi:MAG: hypothetical protein CMJ81_09830 [Planctomycetaceae bacterium]|jgi:hypothetical protein|nr:hypothetical protein [Planctomycetaceae bacterium]MBP63744.1 hypothetical protein [Planctomycetaceae bacterium]